MPTIIMSKLAGKLDGSIQAKTMLFLQKLSADDTIPGLHVEPVHNCVDRRVRTGKVDNFWRAVMFRLDHNGERHYVIHGVWAHDDAYVEAERVTLTMNPINGLPQIESVARPEAAIQPAAAAPTMPPTIEPVRAADAEPAGQTDPVEPLLRRLGRSRTDLIDRLGVPETVADQVLAARDEDEVLRIAQRHEGWLGLLLVDLATSELVDSIAERLQLEKPAQSSGDADADLLHSLKRPAAQIQFAFIGDQEELRQVIENGDFGAWRVFLHPEQRRYVERTYSGPFRLTGGAGTGKTVVLVHRARALSRRDPRSRIVLTTFTTNLADSLRDSLARLDPRIPQVTALGQPGVRISGVDALAASVIRSGGTRIGAAVRAVLGEDRANPTGRISNDRWRAVLDASDTNLPPEIANERFMATEYALVVLPNRLHDKDGYLRVRRPGRGVALDRAKRAGVWELVAAYRAQNRVDGKLDYMEAASVAAAHLASAGGDQRPVVDHVLVDEGQDLSPAHWQMLRALVASGPNDIFIAEDSHQRIYGPRTFLSRYGIGIVGRSRRLTLNYRTTAQNLGYAMSILDGGDYVDLEEQAESTGYRSARSGPVPRVHAVTSLAAELDTIADCARGWISDGAEKETIAVLVADRFQRERVVNGLSERGVPARAVDRDKSASGAVQVMTMHRAKGMEFSKVILAAGATSAAERARTRHLDETERRDAELRARSLRYVAATRARDELTVLSRI